MRIPPWTAAAVECSTKLCRAKSTHLLMISSTPARRRSGGEDLDLSKRQQGDEVECVSILTSLREVLVTARAPRMRGRGIA